MSYAPISDYPIETGFDVVFRYVQDITHGLFIPMLLLSLWLIICLNLYFNANRRTGNGDFPVASMVASFVTVIVTILFKLIEGMVTDQLFLLVLVVTIINLVWLLFTRDQ